MNPDSQREVQGDGEITRVLVVGMGQAGGEFAAGLRARGYAGQLTMVGAEDHVPYSRPPLSKSYLRGDVPAEELYLRPIAFYQQRDITVLTGSSVRAIDPDRHVALLEDGDEIGWDRLVIATGGEPRRLQDPRLDEAANVHYVRTISDFDRLRAAAQHGSHFVVVGGGFVGLEVASVLRGLGARVTVLEVGDRLLGRVTSPVVSEFFRLLHEENGVDVRLGTSIDGYEFDGTGAVASIRLAAGTVLPVDHVLVGIGMVPSEQLAVTAGIDTDNGIVVDDYCRTSRSDVYAIGDVTRHPDGRTGGLRRLESMANAAAQARVAADHFMGVDAPYHDVPWFWSDQYDVKLQTAGLMGDFDELVVRGEPQHDKKFCVLYLKEGKIQAVDAVSSPADFAIGKRLVEGRVQVDPAELADVQNPLRSFLPTGATRKA